MGYGLKRLLEIEAEKKRKKEEKARLKKEKEEEKKRLKRIEHKKKLKKKQNQRAYKKVKDARQSFIEKTGDEAGYFSLYLVQNHRRKGYFSKFRYKNSALKKFHELIEENQNTVKFPVKYHFSSQESNSTKNKHIAKYEIVVTQKVDTEENSIKQLKDENGKWVDNIIVDCPLHAIIAKHDWLVEETFHVWGFNPKSDRKDYTFIKNDIILQPKDTMFKRIMIYNNKLIIHYDTDFDFVMCKDLEQTNDLYMQLEKELKDEGHDDILFMGELSNTTSSWIIEELIEKTGWTRAKIHKVTT